MFILCRGILVTPEFHLPANTCSGMYTRICGATPENTLTHCSQWHPPDVSCQSLWPAPSPHSCCYAVFETMVTVKVPVGSVSLSVWT